MKFLALSLLLAFAAAWMPPPGLVEEFEPEIPIQSMTFKEGASSKVGFDVFELMVEELAAGGIGIEVTDEYTDDHNGVRHVWTRQVVDGLPVENARGNINIDRNGNVMSNFHRFTQKIHQKPSSEPTLSAVDALIAFSTRVLRRNVPEDVAVVNDVDGHEVVMEAPDFAYQPMYADRRWVELEDGSLRLAWRVNVDFDDAWYDVAVDAHNGETLMLNNWVHWFSYEAFPPGIMSPEDAPGQRQRLAEHVDGSFAPLGWHDQGNGPIRNTQGNNVRAQENLSGRIFGWENNYRPEPNANDEFFFPLNLNQQPRDSLDAAITNLFYHNNIFHDFLYQAGFNEVSGNFQQNNFGRGGRGGDPVTAQCQDGSGLNNANFATPPDGSPGRMRMYVWSQWNPRKDGDYDQGIIYHEFAHGLSHRLTGGPSTVGCLSGSQAGGMGEGWGDFLGHIFATRPEYHRNQVFGIGGYVVPGITIRNWPYSSNRTVAPQLYTNVPGLPIHQIGAVWATFLFEVYWNFVDTFGFDPDWLRGSGGNNVALRLVVDGMKLQPCTPSIVQARDGILEAARQNHNGDVEWCLVWHGFATRGVGVGAPANAGSNSFVVPAQCNQILAEHGLPRIGSM